MKIFVLILVNVYMVHGYGECFPEMVNKTFIHLPPQNGPPVVNTPSNEECFQRCVENVKCIAYTFQYKSLECSLFHFMPDIELPEKKIPCQGHCLTRYLSLPRWCKDISNDTPSYHSHLISFGVLCKNQLKMQIENDNLKKEMENMSTKHQEKITNMEKTIQIENDNLKKEMENMSTKHQEKMTNMEKTIQEKMTNMEKTIQIENDNLKKEMENMSTKHQIENDNLKKEMENMSTKHQEKMTNMEKSIQRLSELTIGISAEEYNKLNDVVKAIVAKLSGGWIRNPDTGFSYIIIEQDLTWDEARSACRNKDERADLAFIRNQREQEFIIRNFLQSRSCSGLYWYNSCGVWIGLRDTVGDNQNYEWSAKFPVTYTNWLPGEPNVRQERCGAQQTVSPYKWWDAPCSAKRPVLCVKTGKKENSCLEGWSHYPPTGSCFKTLDEKLYWEEAKTTCAAMARGSSLAKITTREENNFVVDLMKKNDKNEKVGYWMGANDVGRESFFVWLDGSKVVPLSTVVPYWKSGEPNNLHNEDCIHWFKEHNYGWNDAGCKLDYRGQRGMSAVCKMPAL